MKKIRYCRLRETISRSKINQPGVPSRLSMPHFPPTLWGFLTIAGCVSTVGTVFIYVAKKALDIAAEVLKARLLKEHPKECICIYGPDGTVARRVKADSP